MSDEQLNAFFEPMGVVVIGASRDENKLGFGVARNLLASGYQGRVALVNQKGGELFGHPIIQSLDQIGFPVDLGIVVVPAQYVPETLIACSQKSIRSIIVISGGFREAGKEGAVLEEVCRKIAIENGLRILGPNCIGVIDTHAPLDTTFIQPPMPSPGEIAFISQSGALGAAMVDWARGEGFSFSQVVSMGNQIDVSEADMLVLAARSDHTSVITLYLESIQNGPAFLRKVSSVTPRKPVIALKVGRSRAGQLAASSHTGALAGKNNAYEAAFRKSGVIVAETTKELFEWAKMLAWTPSLPKSSNVAVLTNAGGPGVTAADAIAKARLTMAEYSASTVDALTTLLPAAASVGNPVDMLASASPDIYAQCLNILLLDPNVDMVLVIAPPPPMFKSIDVAKAISKVISRSEKPVVVSFMGSTLVKDAVNYLRKKKIPEYRFPEQAVRTLAAMRNYAEIRERDYSVPLIPAGKLDIGRALEIINKNLDIPGFLPAKDAERVMGYSGLPVVPLSFAESISEAEEIAEKMGYPVAMKIASTKLSHKTDFGGVYLNLKSADDVRNAFHRLHERVEKERLADEVDGVFLQRMIKGGQEVIVGAVRDPVFGPMLMFGSGGVEVEGLKDVQFSLIPPSNHEIEYLLESTWAGRKLGGFRNFGKADLKSVKEILAHLSSLMLAIPEIKEVEINPVIVLEEGMGAFAVDSRILV